MRLKTHAYGMAITKLTPICELGERHVGQGYKNNQASATFIALDEQRSLLQPLSRDNFFSLQADGTTDFRNMENKLFFSYLL